ncbi:MAG: substrate-binding domain-containing protein [Ktedonobacterales bacterium]|nr:substrate-binding domain-containing protein [Ktedonobacterales bacterium]
MGFTAALSSFSVTLGIAAVVGAALAYLLGHDPTDPRRHLKRRLTALATLIAFLVIITTQYFAAPQDSLVAYIPGVPFPGATIGACQVTANDLPRANTTRAVPASDAAIAGQSFTIGGGSVFTNFLAPVASRFDAANGTLTKISISNSGEGFNDLYQHLVDISMADRFADPHDPITARFVDHQIGIIVFTLVVSADIGGTVRNLTTNQIKDIFAGKVTNWHEVGGPNIPITVLNRQKSSGTRITFEQYILGGTLASNVGTEAETTQDIIDGFGRTKGAISYISTASLTPTNQRFMFPLCIDGFPPTEASVGSGNYVYWDLEHAYTYSSPARGSAVRDFLNFLCGTDFKSHDLRNGGFLQLPQLSQDALATHPNYNFNECSPPVA